MKQFFAKYKHSLMFLYALIYLPWFAYLEKTVGVNPEYIIHTRLDDLIPFNEYFIIPYMLWFFFIAVAVIYFFFKNTSDFYKLTSYLFIGMTLFLVISTVFPNGQLLRPTEFARDNMFVDMVKNLYQIDTPTNIFPSIHVYNSLCVWVAVLKSKELRRYRTIQIGTGILSVAIVLSTMFLKQHSVWDVVAGIGLCAVVYPLVYNVDYSSLFQRKSTKQAVERL